MSRPPRVFLAAPYSQLMDFSIGMVQPLWHARLDLLRNALIERGAEVFSAHHNESWGSKWLGPQICTPVDYAAMVRSDAVCALVGDPPSDGVAVELGWASALAKPTLVVHSPQSPPTPLILGLSTITRADHIEQPERWDDAEIAGVADRTIAVIEPDGFAHEPADSMPPPRMRLPQDVIDSYLAFCSTHACTHTSTSS